MSPAVPVLSSPVLARRRGKQKDNLARMFAATIQYNLIGGLCRSKRVTVRLIGPSKCYQDEIRTGQSGRSYKPRVWGSLKAMFSCHIRSSTSHFRAIRPSIPLLVDIQFTKDTNEERGVTLCLSSNVLQHLRSFQLRPPGRSLCLWQISLLVLGNRYWCGLGTF